MEKRPFESRLGELGNRIRSLRFREGLYLVAASGLLGFLVLMAADWRFQFSARTCFALDLVLLALLFWGVGRALRRTFGRLRPDYLAMVAEGDSPAMENIMVSAVQFRELLATEGGLRGLSRPLVEEEFRLADELTGTVDLTANIRRDSLRRMRKLFLVAAAVAGMGLWLGRDAALAILPRYLDPWGDHPPYSKTQFVLDPRFSTVDFGDSVDITVHTKGERPRDLRLMLRGENGEWRPVPLFVQSEDEYRAKIESVEEDLEFRAHAHRARSRLGRVQVLKLPRIREVVVTYHYPDYTRLDSSTRNLSGNLIEAVKRTRVTLEVGSNRPLSGGMISLLPTSDEAGSEIPLATAAANWVQGTFSLVESGSFALSLVDVDGRRSEEPSVGSINVLPDRAPEVLIREPDVFSLATPDVEVPIEVEAQDDFGITAVELFLTVDKQAREPQRVETDPEQPDSFGAASFEIIASEVGASPGSIIEFFARAWDNDPEGAKAGRSPIHTIRIITDEEYRRMLRELMTAEDLSAQYADLLDELRSLYERQKGLRERTEQLARNLEQPGLLQSEREELDRLARELAEEERDLARSAEALADRMRERTQREPILGIEEQFNRIVNSHAEELSRLAREPMPEAADSLVQPASPASGEGPSAGDEGAPVSLPQVARSVEKQKEAENSLERMLGESQQEIAQVLRRIEDIMRLYGDLVRLAELYQAQKQVTAEAKPYQGIQEASGEALQDLRQVSPEEENVWQGSVEVQQDLCDHAKALLDDATLAQVVPKAYAVAEALDDLYIIPNTGLGALHMARGKGQAGWERAEAARQGFELLFEGECGKCKGSGACSGLCLALGQALGTGGLPVPGMGMGSGASMGSGLAGPAGQGAAGGMGAAVSQLAMNMQNSALGSPSSSMGVYGPETPQGASQTRLTSSRKAKADKIGNGEGSPFASASREVMEIDKRKKARYLPGPAERYPEQYKRLVEEYFRVLAEEGK